MPEPSGFESLLKRHPKNPILSAADWPYQVNTVFNAGATLLEDGTTLLLCRVEDRRGLSHLCAARSKNGIDNWQIDPQPTLPANPEHYPEEQWGIEDPRVTYLPEIEQYAIAFTAYFVGGTVVSLALTRDFREFQRLGPITTPWNKDAAVLPRRINGLWALIHRPLGMDNGSHIWISFSEDLVRWGNHKLIFMSRRGTWWDSHKIGLSSTPIETDQGWLMIYHGVKHTADGLLYRQGLALLDLEDPATCILRGDEWIFSPEESYEMIGDVGDVVFSCGHTIAPDDDTLRLYYGGADTCMALATGSIREMLKWLEKHGRPPDQD